jgi:hypothetical protein
VHEIMIMADSVVMEIGSEILFVSNFVPLNLSSF